MYFMISHKSIFLIQFNCIICTCFTDLILFFHEFSFIIKTHFPTLRKELNTVRAQIFAEASELFPHDVFHHVVVRKTASSECILQGAKNMAVRGYEIVTVGRIRENSPLQSCNWFFCMYRV